MTVTEVVGLGLYLKGAFPYTEWGEVTAEVWFEHLGRYPADIVMDVARSWVRYNTRPPAIADLVAGANPIAVRRQREERAALPQSTGPELTPEQCKANVARIRAELALVASRVPRDDLAAATKRQHRAQDAYDKIRRPDVEDHAPEPVLDAEAEPAYATTGVV